MSAVGMAVATMIVARMLRRKNSVTATTSTTPNIMSNETSRTVDSMNLELSLTGVREMSDRISSLIFSSSALMARATLTVFAPLCLRISRLMPFIPSSSA